ncbi:MAG: bifunctional adenosylcobinamide kinase/adenosylcobinamide-phosphate guanylyltransferase [Rhodobacteraceae bacterium]|nr:bifunctional adenosylcobinamide kinase/adenosylcobinamide-phosphate guanylyltransferase [Paracoccaceae bacterium]
MNKSLPKLTLVLGGAASGKSEWAESLVEAHSVSKTYIATAQAFDDEMKVKIARHKNIRTDGWATVETPLDPVPALENAGADQAVLLDCATLWLSNVMLADHDTDAAADALLSGLQRCAAPVVVVSNEVGQGVVPDTPLGRRFREAQGRLNIALAAQADLAVMVIAGLPQVLKGRLP